jgi:hypothetical protein
MRMRNTIWLVLAVLAIAPVVRAADNGLVLWYNYEEGTVGTVVDQSTKGNNGTVEEGWSGYGLPTYVTSHDSSNAMQFGYGNWETMGWNNVAVPKSTSLANVGTMWSMGGWIRVDSTDAYDSYYQYPKMLSCPNYELTMHATGDPASYFWPYEQDADHGNPPWGQPGSWDMTMGNTGPGLGSWMHVMVTYDGATFKQYINGSLAFSATGFAHQFDNTIWDDPYAAWTNEPLRIGAMLGGGYPGSGGWLRGALDDTAIWGNAYLDAAGVEALYNGTATPLTVDTIPEPATMLLIGLGFALIRRKQA